MSSHRLFLTGNLLMFALCFGSATAADSPAAENSTAGSNRPRVGEVAPDFSLESVGGGTVKVSRLTEKGPVVLVVLRGYPGYQCPICNRQVGQLLQRADEFTEAGAQVVLVYPGPSGNLKERAQELIVDRTIPEHFHLVLDPDYAFTRAYGLRWNAPRETAYPSTFIVDRQRKVRFAHVSKSHGDRTDARTVLQELASLMKETAK